MSQVPWVYYSEVNSLGSRTRGAAAATSTNWMGGFIVTQFTTIGVDTLHWRLYLRKSLVFRELEKRKHSNSFRHHLLLVFSNRLCFYPETSRRTLEDMDEIYIHNSGVFIFGDKPLTERSVRNSSSMLSRGESRRGLLLKLERGSWTSRLPR
jgi:hypothetical protein